MILVATAEASLPHLRDLNDALCCTLVKSILRSTISLSLRFTSLHCTLFWDAVLWWVHSVNIDTTVERVIELRLDLGNYCSVRSLENFLPAAARPRTKKSTWRSCLCESRERAMSAHQMQRLNWSWGLIKVMGFMSPTGRSSCSVFISNNLNFQMELIWLMNTHNPRQERLCRWAQRWSRACSSCSRIYSGQPPDHQIFCYFTIDSRVRN